MTEPPQPQLIRVFLSSPGDVADERGLARRLLKDELPYDPLLRGKVTFDVVSWDDPVAQTPMPATLTPQAAVNRFQPKSSKCDVVVVVLWSRLGTPLPDNCRKPNGEPYLSGTEWECEAALNAKPQPDILIYRRMEEPKIGARDPARDEKFRQYDLVEQFFERFKNPDGSLRRGVTEYETPTGFKERLANDLKCLLRGRLDQSDAKRATTEAAPAWIGSPYPGLRPFAPKEAAIFFGRGREVDALITKLRLDPEQRFLAVVGASGSGKSSLVRAGLLPRLADDAIEGSQHWPVLVLTPGAIGDDPFLALAVELSRVLPPAHVQKPADIARELAKVPQHLMEQVATLLADRPTGAALVLFIDQLEELFTHVPKELQGAFVALLAHAAADPRLRVLATLRADFLPQCAADPALATLLRDRTFVLGPPGPAALADMIRKPAERAGLELEESLADEILREAGGDPGALPLVAFCLEELYRQTAPEHHLALEAYRALGALRGAIGRRADTLLDKLRKAEGVDLDAALPGVFRALVHVDAAGKAARQRASRDELMAAPAPIPQLVNVLIDPGRLLLADNAGSQSTVTLAHEALFQEWPALREWLEQNRAQMQGVQRQLLNLEAPEPKDRRRAVEVLAEMLAEIGPVPVPALITALRDADRGVRRTAAATLRAIGPAAAEAVPALITALRDANWVVRRTAVQALGSIGPAAVPALITAISDADENVREAAAKALRRIRSASV